MLMIFIQLKVAGGISLLVKVLRKLYLEVFLTSGVLIYIIRQVLEQLSVHRYKRFLSQGMVLVSLTVTYLSIHLFWIVVLLALGICLKLSWELLSLAHPGAMII